jgi:hypothetical protein
VTAANRAITARFGEQPNPIRHDSGGSLHTVEAIEAAGVPIAFAADAIYTYVTTELTYQERPPRTLNYFTQYVVERWRASEEHRAAATSDATLLPTATPNGGGSFTGALAKMRARGEHI